jgi:predicted MFS family arabinose efflux permease
VYGYYQVVWSVGSVALFSAGGELTAAFALHGILALMAGVTLALAPLLLLLPDAQAPIAASTEEDRGGASPLLGVMTLAAILLYLTVSAAVYMFSAPLGERAGLGTSAVGYALTVASLVGLAGAAAAAAINVRWGRALPISAFCLGFAVVALVLCLSRHPVSYVAALVTSCVVFYFSVPYLFGLAAALDRSGRWAAAAGSAYLLGFAGGPLLAGAVIAAADYRGLAVVCVIGTIVAWGLAMVVEHHVSKKRSLAPVAVPPPTEA